MFHISKIKNLRIYNKKLILPFDKYEKRKGKAVLLLTPNIESSISIINNDIFKSFINRYYNSYYMERDVSFYINNKRINESIIGEEYIYDEDSYIQEAVGIIPRSTNTIIYNGYSVDLISVKKYFSSKKLNNYANEFKVKLEYPISVTVHRDYSRIKDHDNGINILSRGFFKNDKDYNIYCNAVMVDYICSKINDKCSPVIVTVISTVYSGYYEKYMINDNSDKKNLIYKEIYDIYNKPNSGSMIVKIIRDGNLNNFFKDVYKDYNILQEEAMDPITKLKRNITFASRRGIHKMDKVVRDVEDVIPDNDIESLQKTSTSSDDNNTEEENGVEEYYIGNINSEYILTENYLQTEDIISYFNTDTVHESSIMRKILYKERLRNNKQMFPIYDRIKRECPNIKRTHINLARYKKFNMFIDISYYNKLFFENNMYKLDRAVNLYLDLLNKFVNNPNITKAGYSQEVIIIPINDWDSNPRTKMWMYNKDINPISVIYRAMRKDLDRLKQIFGNTDILFLSNDKYFKINFNEFESTNINRFLFLFRSLRSNDNIIIQKELIDTENEPIDNKSAIVDTIVDRIEADQNIRLYSVTGKAPSVKRAIVSKTSTNKEEPKIVNKKNDELEVAQINKDKEKILDKIDKAASESKEEEEILDTLGEDLEFSTMVAKLSTEEIDGVKVNNARQARITQLNTEFLDKEIHGVKIRDIQTKSDSEKPLVKTELPIDSINPEWKELTYVSMAEQYNPDADISNIVWSLSDKTYPISVVDINVEDTSTSEDYIYTYTVKLESYKGKRSTLKFDVPKFKDNQYMLLRGNKKTISSQSMLLPILKTEEDTVQIVSNYNKIFIKRFNTTAGKSNIIADKMIKTLKKDIEGINVEYWDNSRICAKYNLPIDYIDMASVLNKITIGTFTIYFNQDEIRSKYKDKIDLKKGLPFAVSNGNIIYYENMGTPISYRILDILYMNQKFIDTYSKINASIRHTYSKASVLNTEIPIIVLASYYEGLLPVLKKAGVDYNITEKRPVKSVYEDIIKFSDGYLSYQIDYNSSLLMNGLKECPTDLYSIGDVNSKNMYLELLDLFGGRIKSDGLDNFYDLMIDPITKDVLNYCKLPTDYVELLLYANNLLVDNKYISHGDMSGRRIRRNELVAGYAYKAISSAYGSYATQNRRGRDAELSMKRTAIIDAILTDNTTGDLSILNPLGEKEAYDTVTTMGLSGMNSDRSYSIDKRSYDDSMVNVLSMSTGFADTVGIGRQATIDAKVSTVRGYVQPTKEEDMNSINSLCMTEALTPMGTTRDDPFRTAMTFVQTSKHMMKTKKSDPLLVTSGADEALPYLISDIFAYKSKDSGEVVEITDTEMIVRYNNGSYDYINLKEEVEKNSASGFYITLKKDTDLKVGSKFKRNTIIAYDKEAFSNRVGPNNNIAYDLGVLTKCVMIDTDEGFEDSAIISSQLSEAMTSDVVISKQVDISPNTNIYNMIDIGQSVQDGDTLIALQSQFSDEDSSILLKNLVADEDEVSDLGKINIKSSVNGIVQDIVIYRTVELEELSESLQKLCRKYERNVKSRVDLMKKYNIDKLEELPANYKLEATGKLKNTDGVSIIFYLKYEDKMSIGDKLIYWSANKGVVKYIIPEGKEPYMLDRPDEKVHTLVSVASVNGRMVASIQNIGVINRLIIEATRKIKDMAGIPYDIDLI